MAGEGSKKVLATQLYTRGTDAIKQKNLDYAVDCFLKCTRLVPDHLEYRKSLRAVEKKKYADNGKGATGAGLRSQGAKAKLKVARARSRWSDVIENAEDILQLNPWDVDALYEIGNACKEMEGMEEVGHWVMQTACETNKDRADLFKLLALFCERRKLFKDAIRCLERAKQLDPKDHELAAKMQQLSADDTIKEGRYEESSDPNNPSKKAPGGPATGGSTGGGGGTASGPTTAALPDSPEGRIRREIQVAEEKLKTDPSNPSLYVQLGDALRKLGEIDKARETYERGNKASDGRDQDLRARVAESRVDPIRKKIEELKTQMERVDRKSPEARAQLEKMVQQGRGFEQELLRAEVEFYRTRLASNSDDHAASFELGSRLVKLKEYDEAIRALQAGRGDQRNKWRALKELGRAFFGKRNHTLADKNLVEALASVPGGDEGARKEVLYWRGRVAEDRGMKDLAIECYNEIASIDYGYLDVSKRLDRLNAPAEGTEE